MPTIKKIQGVRPVIPNKKYIIDLRGRGLDVEQETFYGTAKQASDYRDKLLVELREPKQRMAHEPPAHLAAACAEFLAEQQKRIEDDEIGVGEFTNKTRHLNQMCEVRIGNKTVGSLALHDVTKDVLNDNVRRSMKKRLAAKTLRSTFVSIKQFFTWCENEDWILKSPANGIKISLKGKKNKRAREKRVIDPQEIKDLIEAAPETYKREIEFAARTGLRAGEQRALTWDAVDLDLGYVNIVSAIKWCGEEDEPKTEKGERSIPLPGSLIQMLREWKMRQPLKQRVRNLVFPTRTGQIASSDNWRNRGVQDTIKELGKPHMTWHDLRHFYASTLIFDTSIEGPTIAYYLGHHSLDYTYREYAVYFRHAKRDAEIAQILDAAFQVNGQ